MRALYTSFSFNMADDNIETSSATTLPMKVKTQRKPFRLMTGSRTRTAIFMTQMKNDDIATYKHIARHAWCMETKMWRSIVERHAAMRAHGTLLEYMEFDSQHMAKMKAISGRYRWMAWRSRKGIQAKRAILKMYAQERHEYERIRDGAVKRIMNIVNSSSSWRRTMYDAIDED